MSLINSNESQLKNPEELQKLRGIFEKAKKSMAEIESDKTDIVDEINIEQKALEASLVKIKKLSDIRLKMLQEIKPMQLNGSKELNVLMKLFHRLMAYTLGNDKYLFKTDPKKLIENRLSELTQDTTSRKRFKI